MAVVREISLNRGRGWGDGFHDELGDVQIRALPGLVRGWIETNCDAAGRVYYCAVARIPPKVEPMQDLPRAIPDGGALYDHYLADARDDLKQVTEVGEAGEIGAIPLPVSMGA